MILLFQNDVFTGTFYTYLKIIEYLANFRAIVVTFHVQNYITLLVIFDDPLRPNILCLEVGQYFLGLISILKTFDRDLVSVLVRNQMIENFNLCYVYTVVKCFTFVVIS